MKTTFHKFVSFAMAVLVLLSTTSFIMDAHYCGDSLVDFSFIQHAEGCDMHSQPENNKCETNISKDSCCSDVQIARQGQDEVQLASSGITFDQQVFVLSLVTTYLNLFEVLDTNIIPFRDYRPPILTQDFQKQFETYLI